MFVSVNMFHLFCDQGDSQKPSNLRCKVGVRNPGMRSWDRLREGAGARGGGEKGLFLHIRKSVPVQKWILEGTLFFVILN